MGPYGRCYALQNMYAPKWSKGSSNAPPYWKQMEGYLGGFQ